MQARLTLLVGTVFTAALTLPAQNLVPNPDLEQYTSCPSSSAQIALAAPWTNAMPGALSGPTPDYLNVCAGIGSPVGVPTNSYGSQLPHSGDAYAGLCTYHGDLFDFREYIEVQLTAPLSANECYVLTYFVSQAEGLGTMATSGMGAYFSATPVVQTTWNVLPLVPQLDTLGGVVTDSVDWVMVSDIYHAVGGEEYLVIGNFHNDATTTTVLLDGSPIQQVGYYYIDDVSLVQFKQNCGSVGVAEQAAPGTMLFPNPATNELLVNAPMAGEVTLTLRDATGRLVLECTFINSTSLGVDHLPAGLYTCELSDGQGIVRWERLMKQ